jgi:aryl-alcohol dehydrogenase-like predicted oxidoreductase
MPLDIPKRRLGKTGIDVTILGLGGEGALRTFGNGKEAYRLINRALDLGVTYCESARALVLFRWHIGFSGD